jgi:FMN phosphatase YigB (HAD superfamily)
MIRAISFDYWDTLYHGAPDPARATLRQNAIRRLMRTLGHAVDDAELMAVYRASGAEADRWWREEHRGYTGAERVHWMLRRLGIERPEDCEHVTAACAEVDASLVTLPPPLIDGARQVVETLHRHPQIAALAIVSDSGFASGRGQDRLLEHDQLLDYFPVRIYSCDVGHAKPHARPFQAAVDALGVRPEEVLHIGDEAADRILYINPDECIECGACEPECPVTAIFPEEDVPAAQAEYIKINREIFQGPNPPARPTR